MEVKNLFTPDYYKWFPNTQLDFYNIFSGSHRASCGNNMVNIKTNN
jgi:hypothetical protein